MRQSSFVGGEISPALQARVDLDRFVSSLKRCRNMIVLKQGGVVNRPGFQWLAALKDQTVPTGALSVLIPFVFSESDSFVLEFSSASKIRFYQNGVQIQAGGGGTYEVSHPYAAADLARLRWAQLGDVVTLTHAAYAPYQLKRIAANNWTLTAAASAPSIAAPANLAFDTSTQQPLGGAGARPAPSTFHGARRWEWVVTAEDKDGNESYGSTPLVDTAAVLYADIFPFALMCDPVAGAVRYNFYRGHSDIFGFVGSSSQVDGGTPKVRFQDQAVAPAYSDTPPQFQNPFPSATPKEYPSDVCFYQQRQVFARTDAHRQRLICSMTGQFYRFDTHFPLNADDAITIDIASGAFDEIRAAVSMQDLIVLTGAAIYEVGSGSTDPFTPTTIRSLLQDDVGCSWVRPAKMGGVLAFVERSGRIVQDVHYDGDASGYRSDNISVLAEHLFQGQNDGASGPWRIKRLAYAKAPWSVLWALRSDGTLLGLTYDKTHQVWAWHAHTTPNAEIVDIAVVPENGTDTLYIIAKRGIESELVGLELSSIDGNYTIERMVPRNVTSSQSTAFLDSHVSQVLGEQNTKPLAKITAMLPTSGGGGAWTVGGTVWIRFGESVDDYRWFTYARGAGLLSFVSAWVGKRILFNAPATGDQAQLLVTSLHSRGDLSKADDLICTVEGLTVPVPCRDVATPRWKYGQTSTTGLDNLNGLSCAAMADGVVLTGLAPSGGALTLPWVAASLHIGLPYTAEIQTLAINVKDQPTTGRKRVIKEILLDVEDSRQIEIGESDDKLSSWKMRAAPATSLGPVPFFTEQIRIPVRGDWNEAGSMIVRQDQPLPMTILAATPVVEFGG